MPTITKDTLTLSTIGEQAVHTQFGPGTVAVLFATDMGSGDEFIIRQYAVVDGGTAVVGSKTIEYGTSTDDTWSGTFGSDNAGWQSWPFAFGDDGGSIVIEWVAGGPFNVSFEVLSVAEPTG